MPNLGSRTQSWKHSKKYIIWGGSIWTIVLEMSKSVSRVSRLRLWLLSRAAIPMLRELPSMLVSSWLLLSSTTSMMWLQPCPRRTSRTLWSVFWRTTSMTSIVWCPATLVSSVSLPKISTSVPAEASSIELGESWMMKSRWRADKLKAMGINQAGR